jgi:hypothetical protein
MKKLLILAASATALLTFVPQEADAQGMRRGARGGVVAVGPRGAVVARRGVVRGGYGYGRRGYAYGPYRRGYGWGPAVGVGILGAAALGAAAASTYPAYGYADPCLRQVQDYYGNVVWQRVC